jgi:hypothetical protein
MLAPEMSTSVFCMHLSVRCTRGAIKLFSVDVH